MLHDECCDQRAGRPGRREYAGTYLSGLLRPLVDCPSWGSRSCCWDCHWHRLSCAKGCRQQAGDEQRRALQLHRECGPVEISQLFAARPVLEPQITSQHAYISVLRSEWVLAARWC